MPGGLLNLVSYGAQNVILNGNPSKTFFKTTYAKYTNFGLQKFRLDFDGLRSLRMTEASTFTFKVPRYGDLLMDTYLVVTLPTIWSPILPPTTTTMPNCVQCYETDGGVPPDNGIDCNEPCSDVKDPKCVQNVNVCGPKTEIKPTSEWCPYEFKWIKNLGTQMIKKVKFIVGGQVIQEYTGDHLYNLVERDFDNAKKDLYYKMTGNVAELNDPANAFGRNNEYPNVWPVKGEKYQEMGPEPSIRARKLYIPLNIWFTLAAKMAFPLVSLQYNELNIEVEMRSINELFMIRDVEHIDNVSPGATGPSKYGPGPYIKPDCNNAVFQFYRFLQPIPTKNNFADINTLRSGDVYEDKRTDWAADIHLISTYAFLTEEEVRVFAEKPQKYLIKEAYTYSFNNVVGSQKVDLNALGMVSNWMWFFRRTDAHLRNEWSNYSNWPYENLPQNVEGTDSYVIKCGEFEEDYPCVTSDDKYPDDSDYIKLNETDGSPEACRAECEKQGVPGCCWHRPKSAQQPGQSSACQWIPGGARRQSSAPCNPSPPDPCRSATTCTSSLVGGGVVGVAYPTDYKLSGTFNPENQKEIMLTWALVLDGKYRENTLDAGVLNYVEKYTRTSGNGKDGLYCYNFGLFSAPTDFQPSGAMNMSKFNKIEFEFTTYAPPLDPEAKTMTICNGDGTVIGVNKPIWRIYDYTYDLIVMEERYNVLIFESGNAGLMYAR